LSQNSVSIEELTDIIDLFSIAELYSSDINELILTIIHYLHI